MRRRIVSHKALLRAGKHSNNHMQSSYNKHGSASFSYFGLEITTDFFNREAFFINQIDSNFRFNQSAVVGDEVKSEISPEKRKKISENSKRYLADENCRVKVSIRKRKLSPEQINRVRLDYLKGTKVIDIARSLNVSQDLIGQITRCVRCTIGPDIDKRLVVKCIQYNKTRSHPNKGSPVSRETREKMSIASKKKWQETEFRQKILASRKKEGIN